MAKKRTNRFAEAFRASVVNGFESQALEHGKRLHREAVAIRERDPLVTFLLDTFTRQGKSRRERAGQAEIDGDERLMQELLWAADVADQNKQRVMAAVNGEEIACQ